jgi:hypothetical protein
MRSPYELEMEEHDKHITWMTKNGGFAKDMTMRDHFAGLAMQNIGDLITKPYNNLQSKAEIAYEIADAMLKAREK